MDMTPVCRLRANETSILRRSLTPNLYIVSVDNGEADAEWPSLKRPRRLARPRTPPFHGDNMSSNLIGDTNIFFNRFSISPC